jgi:MGT family glycosyltransferase
MSTILAYTSPALGHLFPMCALLRALAGRGHAVEVRTLSSGVPVCRELGFATAPIDDRIEGIVSSDWLARNSREALRMTIDVFARRGVLEMPDITAAIADTQPDALLIDANCFGAMAVADAGDLPWAVFSPYSPFLDSPGVPPAGAGLRPMPGLAGRIRDHGVRTVVRRVFDAPMLAALNGFRAEQGLAPVWSVDEYLRRAPLILVAGGEPFEYPHHGWGPDVHMIGACAFDPPAAPPSWLAAIDRPLVLVTTSSVRQADTELAATALRALAGEPVHVVVTMPAGVPPGIEVPANATVCDYTPHGLVLDRAVCAVTHGGMGVTQKALARGVPVCVVPYGRDQFEVARRVEVAGCGTRLPAARLTPERLRANVRAAMTMTAGARRVADGFTATGGAARGAELVERLAVSRSARPGPGVAPSSS